MKKLFLLLSVSSIALAAGAQSNSSIIFGAQSQKQAYNGGRANVMTTLHHSAAANTANKTTAGVNNGWFSFADACDDGTSAITRSFVTVSPDSNLLVASASPAFNWWCHGLGVSLDPTSLYFNGLYANPNTSAPPISVSSTDAYTVDSVEVVGLYSRIKNHTDTLYVDIVSTADANVFLPVWHGASLASYGITATGDTTFTVADPSYTYTSNTLNCTSVQRVVKVLDAAAAIDTTASGLNDWSLKIPTAVSVPAGGKVVAYTHFASGFTYPLNTNIDSANTWIQFSYDLAHAPLQVDNDDNGGLVCTTDERYHTANAQTVNGGTPALVPAYFYTAPTQVHDPFIPLHIVCPTCASLDVAAVKSNLSGVNAYPNPATSELNIGFKLANSSNVTVTLTNTMGQVVATQNIANAVSGKATFNTAALAAGVYAYSVIANGERSAGTVVVAH